jgi:hypothetical protein
MSEQNTAIDGLSLWRSVERTDPRATKNFSRGGGFKGTAISPMWLIRQATELWGPIGNEWGVRIVTEKIVPGAPLVTEAGAVLGTEAIHQVQIELFYPGGTVPAFGQTQFVGKNKYGFFTDEEAPKKSLTDALTKALSWLGFAADVHMGLFDDVKYVNSLRAEFEKEDAKASAKACEEAFRVLEGCAEQGGKSLKLAWLDTLNEAQRQACEEQKDRLKAIREIANKADAKKQPARQEKQPA